MRANDNESTLWDLCALILFTVGAWVLVAGMAYAAWWLVDFILNTLPK